MLSTVLIATGLALVPATEAASTYKFTIPAKPAPPSGGYVSTHTTQVSKATCKSVATTSSFSASKDVHVKAVAEAFKYACASDCADPLWYATLYKRVKDADSGTGLAFARAISTASVACDTKGNAYGCAAAYASAKAWAESTSEAHSVAWAEALNECTCNGELQTAYANADATAYEIKELIAKVEAIASTNVCAKSKAGGKDSKADYDASTCIQALYTEVLAKAVARATIEGVCVPAVHWGEKELSYSEYTAKAHADAVATIDIYEVKGCQAFVDHYLPW